MELWNALCDWKFAISRYAVLESFDPVVGDDAAKAPRKVALLVELAAATGYRTLKMSYSDGILFIAYNTTLPQKQGVLDQYCRCRNLVQCRWTWHRHSLMT